MRSRALAIWLFPGAGVAGKDKTLLAFDKFQGGQLHDLPFIDVLLKVKIEIGEEFSFGQFGFFDPPFGPPLRSGMAFKAEQVLEKFSYRGGLGGGPAKFIVEDGGNPL